jgi:ATP-dependent DNA helicase PIF1
MPEDIKITETLPTTFSLDHLQYIAPFHAQVNAYNANALAHNFTGEDEIHKCQARYTFPPGLGFRCADVEHFVIANVPHHVLQLAVGCPVMVLRNINVHDGIANGSLAVVIEIQSNHIVVNMKSSGEDVVLPRINFSIPIGGKKKVIRHQYPVQLAFASTISKVQGKTIRNGCKLIVDVRDPCFLHGQLYVALSRCVNEADLVIVSNTRSLINVVYKQLLPT